MKKKYFMTTAINNREELREMKLKVSSNLSFIAKLLTTTNKLTQLCTKQWSNYMSLNSKWMGNVALGKEAQPPSYLNMHSNAYSILLQSVLHV